MTKVDELIGRMVGAESSFIADPYPVLNEVREQTPVFRFGTTDRWMLTRFADVHAALRDRRLGRTYTHRYTHREFGRSEPDPQWTGFHEHEAFSLLSLEPPDHTRIRRLIAKVFTPTSVSALQPRIASLSDGLLDECAGRGEFDLIADYAQPFSVAVVCSMLGVPVSDTRLLLDWSHAIVKMYELSADDETKRAADRAACEYIDYTRALIADKRREPDGLLVSRLADVEDGGDSLTDHEIISTTMVLMEAGHEATVNTLGNGFRAMMRHPEQWARVVGREVEPAVVVEELLRWDAPLQMFERWVLEPGVVVGGHEFDVGDEVAMLFGSAQRDPRRFHEPDRFDVGRGDASHIGFGGGIHFCIGAPLARAELARSVDGIVRRFPRLALVEDPSYHPTFVIRGLQSLRVTA